MGHHQIFTYGGLTSPAYIGSSAVSAGVVSAFAMNTTAPIAAGDLIVLCVTCLSAATSFPSAISDGTNSYTLAGTVQSTGAGIFNTSLWYKENASAVVAGATITVTLNTPTTGSGNGLAIIASKIVSTLASSFDKTAGGNTAAATSITATTAALAQPIEIAVGTSWSDAGVPTYVGATGFSPASNTSIPGGNGLLVVDYKLTGATTAVSYVPTWGASGRVLGVVATFKGR